MHRDDDDDTRWEKGIMRKSAKNEAYNAGQVPQLLPGTCAKSPIIIPCLNSFLLVIQMLLRPLVEPTGRTVVLSTPINTRFPTIFARPSDWAVA
jgi:hypothetical protein